MSKHVVARVADIPDGGRLLLEVRGRSIGVFNVRGRFYAVHNRCPHQGAELCRGSVLGRLEASAPGEIVYDPSRYLLQCPWHGWEYDLETGQSFFNSRVRSYEVDVEAGAALLADASAGTAVTGPATEHAQTSAERSAPRLQLGPFAAETFPISVEDDYVMVHVPGGGARRPEGPRPLIEAVVAAVRDVAEDVVMLDISRPTGEPLPAWAPGDHVDLVLGPDLERQYSLCGDPTDAERWQVAVLRAPQSRGGSAHVHEELRPGSPLRVRGPHRGFPLTPAPSYMFVAGGIGITPLLPMIDRVDAEGAEWTLLYGGRRRASMAFADRLAKHGDRVAIRPEDEQGLLDLDAALANLPPGAVVYCCGPEPLIAAVEERCQTLPAGVLHVERFRPRPGVLDQSRAPFEVVLARSGTVVPVAADETILDALQGAGVVVPRSCREGTCGTCETVVLDGEPDHRDSFLSEEERAEGATMMVCCSRARTERLVLDL